MNVAVGCRKSNGVEHGGLRVAMQWISQMLFSPGSPSHQCSSASWLSIETVSKAARRLANASFDFMFYRKRIRGFDSGEHERQNGATPWSSLGNAVPAVLLLLHTDSSLAPI
jgi:hypothetical protein